MEIFDYLEPMLLICGGVILGQIFPPEAIIIGVILGTLFMYALTRDVGRSIYYY